MRPLTTEDFWDIWQRRKWWFLGTAFLVAAGTCLVAALIPNLYRSECLILLEGQQISENYVKPLSDTDVDQQLAGLVQETLSRTRLEQIIREFGLAGPGVEKITDQEADNLRKQIDVEVIKGNSAAGRRANPYAFKIGFTGGTPALAQRVTNELASFFVSQKLKTEERTAQETLRFLQTQLEAATKDLLEKEQRLTEFKQRYRGQLPMDEQLNLQMLVRLQSQLQGNRQALERARQEQASLAALEAGTPADPASRTTGGEDSSALKLSPHLQTLKVHLADLQSRYRPGHPDIIKTQDEIGRVEAEIARGESASTNSASGKRGKETSPATSNRKQQVQADIAALLQEEKRLEQQATTLQANLQSIPLREQQYTELQRAYEGSKATYDQIQGKIRDTQLASDVEKRLQGQRFRIQDFASLPDAPSGPVRWKINLGGLAAGLLVGLVLAGGLELRDSSIKSDRDVEYYLQVKNLATVPELQTPAEVEQMRRKKLIWAISSASVIVVLAGLLSYLYFLRM